MDEDLELNRLVKSALEARAPLRLKTPRPSRRRVCWRWAAATLLAASVALVATFHVPGRKESAPIEEALRLLSEVEGLDSESGESSIDLLLAWQESV